MTSQDSPTRVAGMSQTTARPARPAPAPSAPAPSAPPPTGAAAAASSWCSG